jgi:cell division protein FtsB
MLDTKNITSTYCTALLLWTTAVIGIGMFKGQSSIDLYLSLKDSEVILTKTVESLKTENAKLSQEIFKVKNSPEYARKVLRDKYHVTDSDEKIVYFAD